MWPGNIFFKTAATAKITGILWGVVANSDGGSEGCSVRLGDEVSKMLTMHETDISCYCYH